MLQALADPPLQGARFPALWSDRGRGRPARRRVLSRRRAQPLGTCRVTTHQRRPASLVRRPMTPGRCQVGTDPAAAAEVPAAETPVSQTHGEDPARAADRTIRRLTGTQTELRRTATHEGAPPRRRRGKRGRAAVAGPARALRQRRTAAAMAAPGSLSQAPVAISPARDKIRARRRPRAAATDRLADGSARATLLRTGPERAPLTRSRSETAPGAADNVNIPRSAAVPQPIMGL